MMTISDLEEAYEQAHGRMLRGELDDEEFKAEVDRLRYEDDQGRQWKIGWYTGRWYRHDHGQWVQGTPVERQAGSPPPAATAAGRALDASPARRPQAVWLAAGLAALLLVASVVLVLGWNTDWWSSGKVPNVPDDSVGQVAGTAVESAPAATLQPQASPQPPATARPTSTVTPLPSATTRPTATRRPQPSATRPAPSSPTATVTPTPAVEPSASPKPSPMPSASPAASQAPAAATAARTPRLSGQIFFPVYDPNPDRRTFDIYAVRLPDGPREIVAGQASQPALSRNGERLAYRSWDKGQRGLVVHELTTGNTWTWVQYGEAARPSWSPDNQNIVFPSRQESDRNWRLYRTMGLEVDRVRRHGGDIFGRVPVWLADGRIVYWECPEDKCGLYIMKGDGTTPVRLTLAEHDTAPAVSPDGRVAFMSDRTGNWEIYVLDMDQPEGAGEEGVTRLTSNTARDGLPTWSPDGQWLAFVSDRDGAWAVWAMRPDGSEQTRLFALGGPLEGEIALVTADDQNGWTWEALAWGP